MKTILVVEDDKNQLILYKNELSLEGYNIITAMDGCEAISKARDYSPDLIIMDIQMPRMDGIESIGKILGERRNVPIIINTAYSNYKNKFASWSADAYIIKSSDLNELKEKIKELIR
ncbi:MAG: Response regulator [Candidatus Jettenia ecosi]|uniref:Response regulator n=1 Tax=Candidatus Jettenia ecosi TaxID=2494326 RepID=A0A533Q9H3_9BACT|nr:MAG: Response regulator [Candidatus Jettenia ecosi]